MSQVKILKIDYDGVPVEHSQIDELIFASFTVSGGGPSMGVSGIDMTNQNIKNLKNLLFTDPSVDYLNQTVGNLIIDNIMAKDRGNSMTTAADILFPIIQNVSGQVDAFRLPAVSGTPTAAPAAGGAGYLVYDYVNGKPYAWTGTSWDDLTTAFSTENIDDPNYINGAGVSARDVVYLSGSNQVDKALGDATIKSRALGFAVATVGAGLATTVRKIGTMGGFTGLTLGAREYLHPTSAGLITESVPTGTGNTIVQVGYARTTTSIDIQILQLGRRS